jgi:hypothetical protein
MAESKWAYIKSRFVEIEVWLKGGLNESQIIKNLAISKTTFEKYKHEQPELVELLKKGVNNQVGEVENALYKTAIGYHYIDEVAFKCKEVYYDGNGQRCEREEVKSAPVNKFHAPETAAMAFFLKNKDKKNWGDNPQLIDIRREELTYKKQHEDDFGSW